MAKPVKLSQRLGVTRGKLALIAGLACVLVGVLYLQLGGSDAPSNGAHRTDPSRARPVTPVTARQAKKPFDGDITPVEEEIEAVSLGNSEPSLAEQLWASPRLARVIEYDPFAVPARFPRPAPIAVGNALEVEDDGMSEEQRLTTMVEELQMQLEELRQRGVHVIVRERDGFVAMIGDRTVHVGDDINGFTVTAIEPNGVRVERKIQE